MALTDPPGLDGGPVLRVGLLGYGDAGRGIHGRLLRATGHRVTHVLTRSASRADAAAGEWPGVRVHADLDGLLGVREQIDLLVVATPTGRHAEHAAACLRAGVPTVVDKPLGVDAVDVRASLEVARATGTPLTVFHNRRWDREQLTLAALLEQGTLGRVHRFERRWERWRPVPKDRWKERAVGDGGGLLLDLGSHLVDSATQLFGPVDGVRAELRSLLTPTEDDVFLALDHASGVISHLWAGGLVGAPGPRTRVLGDAGAYLVTDFEGEATPFGRLSPGGDAEGLLVRGDECTPVRAAPGGHEGFYRAAARWIVEGGPPPVDPADALETALVLDAARRAAVTGGRVSPSR